MTEMKRLSNAVVIIGLKNCIKIDRENEAEMIAYIEEVDRRKLFLEFGYNSLFAFLTTDLGLSNASAQLRIDSARLMKAVPEIREDLTAGKLHMSQLAFVAQALRQKKKESPQVSVSAEEKKCLIEKIKESPDTKTTQKIIAQELDLEIRDREKMRVQKDESIRLEISLTKEQMHVIERAKELLSHSNPNPNWAELYFMLADRLVKQKDPVRERKVKLTSGPEVAPQRAPLRPHITAHDRRFVHRRDRSCLVCGSTFQLQIDHVQPLWAGGSSDPSNLRLLCAVHNREKYRREAGIRSRSD